MEESIKIRVRFNETDSMNFLYHGNYAAYYHASRTELLRKVGLCDNTLGKKGKILPVVKLESKFIKPAFYDDELIVKTILYKVSACRLFFKHEIINPKKEIINKGCTVVAYVDNETREPERIPSSFLESLDCLVVE